MKLIIFVVVLIGVLVFVQSSSSSIENFWSRPNKCFDCEKQITSLADAHLAFPTKCFDCEAQAKNQGQIPYFTGPTKCFGCEPNPNQQCKSNNKSKELDGEFELFGRNMYPVGRF
jgi:hypothetical protein